MSKTAPADRTPPSDAQPDGERAANGAQLAAGARELGLTLSPSQCERLLKFIGLLQRWNATHNLTSVTDTAQAISHHLLDSLSIAVELPESEPLRILDAGAGAGLPGIPLAIACPSHRYTLVDAVAKKCAFVTQACLELSLPNVQARHARLEQLRTGPYDVIASRALGSLSTLTQLTDHLLAPGGRWLSMKGLRPDEELRELPPGVRVERIVTLRVPLLDETRHLVVLQRSPRDPIESTP